jgi:hypothetical protein
MGAICGPRRLRRYKNRPNMPHPQRQASKRFGDVKNYAGAFEYSSGKIVFAKSILLTGTKSVQDATWHVGGQGPRTRGSRGVKIDLRAEGEIGDIARYVTAVTADCPRGAAKRDRSGTGPKLLTGRRGATRGGSIGANRGIRGHSGISCNSHVAWLS